MTLYVFHSELNAQEALEGNWVLVCRHTFFPKTFQELKKLEFQELYGIYEEVYACLEALYKFNSEN